MNVTRISRWTAGLLVLTILLFLGTCWRLGRITRWPGNPDSVSNQDAARNLVEGRGFTANTIYFYWDRQSFPNPETVRPPAVPYCLAALVRVFGESSTAPVMLTALVIVLAALCVRWGVHRATGRPWAGDIAALLLLWSYAYEVISLMNNSFLTLAAALLLFVGERPPRADGRGPSVVGLAACGAFGFLAKPTFMIAAIPYGLLALRPAPGAARSWARSAAGFLLWFAVFTSPIWIRNWMHFGDPLYHPVKAGRYAVTYHILPDDWLCIRTVRYDQPVTIHEVIHRIGFRTPLRIHLNSCTNAIAQYFHLSPGLIFFILQALLLASGATWRSFRPGVVLAGGPFFEALYWHADDRYSWPAIVPLLFLAANLYAAAEATSPDHPPAFMRRARTLLAITAAFAILHGVARSDAYWEPRFSLARSYEKPGWIDAVSRLPADAIVMAPEPWHVSWYSRRRSVLTPFGSRVDLFKVVAQCRPTHVLVDGPKIKASADQHFRPDELRSIARQGSWELFELRATW